MRGCVGFYEGEMVPDRIYYVASENFRFRVVIHAILDAACQLS